jgi:hypothetical protein
MGRATTGLFAPNRCRLRSRNSRKASRGPGKTETVSLGKRGIPRGPCDEIPLEHSTTRLIRVTSSLWKKAADFEKAWNRAV